MSLNLWKKSPSNLLLFSMSSNWLIASKPNKKNGIEKASNSAVARKWMARSLWCQSVSPVGGVEENREIFPPFFALLISIRVFGVSSPCSSSAVVDQTAAIFTVAINWFASKLAHSSTFFSRKETPNRQIWGGVFYAYFCLKFGCRAAVKA